MGVISASSNANCSPAASTCRHMMATKPFTCIWRAPIVCQLDTTRRSATPCTSTTRADPPKALRRELLGHLCCMVLLVSNATSWQRDPHCRGACRIHDHRNAWRATQSNQARLKVRASVPLRVRALHWILQPPQPPSGAPCLPLGHAGWHHCMQHRWTQRRYMQAYVMFVCFDLHCCLSRHALARQYTAETHQPLLQCQHIVSLEHACIAAQPHSRLQA